MANLLLVALAVVAMTGLCYCISKTRANWRDGYVRVVILGGIAALSCLLFLLFLLFQLVIRNSDFP